MMRRSLWSLASAGAGVLLLLYEYVTHQARIDAIFQADNPVNALLLDWFLSCFMAALALSVLFLCMGFLFRATGLSITSGVFFCIIWLLAPGLQDAVAVLLLMVLTFIGVAMQGRLDRRYQTRLRRGPDEYGEK